MLGFRAAGVRLVASLGGDGTLHHLVNCLVRHCDPGSAPALLPLAGGTMNGLARALGTGGSPERRLRAAVAALAIGMPALDERRLLQVTVSGGANRLGFGFATGLVYRAFRSYYRRPQPGRADAIRASLLPLTGIAGGFYDGVTFEVEADGAPWLAEPAHSLVASVVDRPVLWFQPFGPPLGEAAAFHLAATAMRPLELAPRLWSVFRGRCRHPRLRAGPVRDVIIRPAHGYVIDGELYPVDRGVDLRITLGPSLRFLIPRGGSHR